MTKVITVKSMARAAASPQKPCSARFKIFIDASGVLKETRKITALIVPTPRTKLYTKALKKAPFESGKIIVKYVLIFPAPKEDAASSSDEFIWLTFDAMERKENGIKPIVIAMIIKKAEFVNLSFDAAIEIARPNKVPGTAAGNWTNTSKYFFNGDFVL